MFKNSEYSTIGHNQNNDILLKSKNKLFVLQKNKIREIEKVKTSIFWSKIFLADKTTAKKYLSIHQGSGVSLHRIMTELHNGRFFGSIFSYILFMICVVSPGRVPHPLSISVNFILDFYVFTDWSTMTLVRSPL